MKQLIILLFVACIFLVSGCTAEAPPCQVESAEPETETTEASMVSSEPQATENIPVWNTDPIREKVAPPPGVVLEYLNDGNYRSAWLGNTTDTKLNTYWQKLLDSGFEAYHSESKEETEWGPMYSYFAKNKDGIIVQLEFGAMLFGNGSEKPQGSVAYISVYDEWQRLQNIEPEVAPWESFERYMFLPEPDPSFTKLRLEESFSGDIPDRYYYMEFGYMDYEGIKAYAQLLREYGYCLEEAVDDRPFMNQYSFCAKNETGYMVELVMAGEASSNNKIAYLLLYEPGVDGNGRDWEDDIFSRIYLPEPEGKNYSQWNPDYLDNSVTLFRLDAMDYTATKEYALLLQDYGYLSTINVHDDPSTSQYTLKASGEFSAAFGGGTVKCVITLEHNPIDSMDSQDSYSTLLLEVIRVN